MNYSSKNCTFTKTIVALDASEPADMKSALEGKSLSCPYEEGAFDSNWTDSLILGIGNCTGPLADALGQLSVFATG